jgi:hypothetical protein
MQQDTRLRGRTLALALALGLTLASCGGDDDRDGGSQRSAQSEEITFTGDLEAFPDYNYDSQWLPEGSPVQVRVIFDVAGSLHAEAGALVGGSADAPQMSGVSQSGLYQLEARLNFQVLLKVDLPGVGFEGPLSEDTDISYEIAGETTFDPFVIDEIATLQAEIPETMLVTLPLAGSVPGVEGNVIIRIRGTANSEFEGDCAAVNSAQAQYRADTRTNADIVLLPSLMVEVPFVYNETIDVGQVPVTIPAVELPMDLGTLSVTPGGGDVDGGGSMARAGSCDDTNNGGGDTNNAGNNASNNANNGGGDTNNGGGDANNASNNANNGGGDTNNGGGDTNNGGNNANNNDAPMCAVDADCAGGQVCQSGACVQAPDPEDTCAQTCDGCCLDGVCLDGDSQSACGVRGARCEVCEDHLSCGAGVCGVDPNTLWDVEVVRADFLEDPNEGVWDNFGGAPDVYVHVGFQYDEDREEFIYSGDTSIIDDDASGAYAWSQVVIEGLPASVLLNDSISLALRDSDLLGDETMAGCSSITDASMLTGQEVTFCEGFGRVAFFIRFSPSR